MFKEIDRGPHENFYDEFDYSEASTDEIVCAIESVLPKRRPIEHHEPFVNKKKATVEIANCIAYGIEKYRQVELFEEWLSKFTGAEYVLATNTGTSALHVALLAAGVKHRDEVIVPSTTFVATANAVSHAGAVPHFIDGAPTIDPVHLKEYIERETKPADDGKGRINRDHQRLTAIIVVHLLGYPADIVGICKVAEELGLIVIEDASQALGTRINGKHVGTFGWVGTFSFNNNKILATSGGGAVITNSCNIHFDARQLASTARKPHQWLVEHESAAYNYRMGAINAALGFTQAQDIKKTLAVKQGLALRYRKALKGMVEFVEPPIECEPNFWLNSILVDNRDELLEKLHAKGIRARASFTPLHLLPFYKYSLGGLYSYQYNAQENQMPQAMRFFERCVCLPSGSNL